MSELACQMKRLAIVPAFAAAMILSGCGGGGIELEGPGFQAIGLTSKKYVEKKVPDRAPLVIPPNRARLPEPAAATRVAAPQNWPRDPEKLLNAEENELEKIKKEYMDKGDWSKKADIDEFEKAMDPMKRQPGILSKGKPLRDEYRDAKKYEN